MIDFWKSLIEHVLGWPVAAFFLGLLFRKPLTALLARINYIKAPGFDLSAPQPAASAQNEPNTLPPPDALKGEIPSTTPDTAIVATAAPVAAPANLIERRQAVENFGRGIPIVDESVGLITNELEALNMPLDSTETSEVLVRHLATTQLMLRCERTHRLIFGSQIVALHLLNNLGRQPEAALEPIFENAREREPQFYGSYTVKQWIGFLIKEVTVLVTDDGRYGITVYGQNYLEYIGIFAPGAKPH